MLKVAICENCKSEAKIKARSLCSRCYDKKWYRTFPRKRQVLQEKWQGNAASQRKAYKATYREKHPFSAKSSWLRHKYGPAILADRQRQAELFKTPHPSAVYGEYIEWYHVMLERQNGVCAVAGCGVSGTDAKPLVVDHCHRTGALRGLLCNNCNVALGLLRDSPALIQSLAGYLASKELQPAPRHALVQIIAHG